MALATVTAVFTGAEDTVAVVYSGITTNPPSVVPGAPVVTDGGPGPDVWIAGAPTNTGCTVATSARFAGKVTLIVMD